MSDQIEAVRDVIAAILRENGVKRAAFFGSIVRGEMEEGSDIDILIEFEGRRSFLDLAHRNRSSLGLISDHDTQRMQHDIS